MEEKAFPIRLEQKFRLKEKDTIYIVKRIKHNEILLVTEDGRASMLVQKESLSFSRFEPIYD